MNKSTKLQTVSLQEKEAMVVHAARNELVSFSIATDPKYTPNWFHEALSLALELAMRKVEKGEDARIIVEAPPRHGKSETSTKKFPAWVLGHHPDWPIVVGSYSTDLALKFGQDTRDIMQTAQYQRIFNSRLRVDTKAKGYWKTDQGGSYFAAGAGGAFTGSGFKIGIIDDIFKNREEADSQTIRNSRWDWWKSTFYTRQEGCTGIIIVNTRWHTDDLVGRLLKEQQENEENGVENYDKWTKLTFAALAIEDEICRNKGEALWPEKFSKEKLEKTEVALGPYEFSALYQCNPISSEHQEFKESWFKRASWSEVEAMDTRKFATIDPGGKEEENDYTGIVRNYVSSQNKWYIKAMGVHFDSMELMNYVFTLHDEGFEKIAIEETVYLKAVKPYFDEKCRKMNKFPNVIPIKQPPTQKEVRIRGLIPRYKSGSIFHIDGECRDLETQLVVFPKGANDDVPDALAMQNDIAEAPVDQYVKAAMRNEREQRKEQLKKNYGLG